MNKPLSRTEIVKAQMDSLFDAAMRHGESSRAVVRILADFKIKWTDKERVAIIGGIYKLGRIAGYLTLTREQAQKVIDKKEPKDGDASDDRRTLQEHKAYRAAVSAWSECARLAGMPNKVTNAARPAKNKPDEAPKAESDTFLAAPSISNASELHAFALRMADIMTKFINRNGTQVTGDCGSAMNAYVAAVRAIPKG